MGIHAIDTAQFLLGDPVPVRVVASVVWLTVSTRSMPVPSC